MDTVYTTLDFLNKVQINFASDDSKLGMIFKMAEYGDVVCSKGMTYRYFVNDPDTIHQVLVKNAHKYTKAGTSFMKVRDVLGVGQLTGFGDAWYQSNKIAKPYFYQKNLEQCVPIINEYTDKMLDDWQWYANKQRPLNIVEEMSKLVLSISCALLFGQRKPENPRRTVKHIRYANKYVATTRNIWKYKPTIPNLRFQVAKKHINELCEELLMPPHDEVEGIGPLLMPFFVDPHASKEELTKGLGEAKNLLIAGHETTGLALSWAFYNLGENAFHYEKFFEEVTDVLQDQEPTFENYNELHLTQRIIKETIRLYPPIWSMERSVLDDDQFGDMQVPRGSHIFICPYAIHRNPKYWDSPDLFNPERFKPKYAKNRPKCAYIPFGMGERVCIGKHLAMLITTCVLAKVAQRYHFRLESGQEILTDPLITLRPYPDTKIRIQNI